VSSNFVANVLLSAGALPAMVDNPEDLFAGVADGVLINLGTPTTAQVESMRLAGAARFCRGSRRPAARLAPW
jgi:hydroxyethylthiazole kinase